MGICPFLQFGGHCKVEKKEKKASWANSPSTSLFSSMCKGNKTHAISLGSFLNRRLSWLHLLSDIPSLIGSYTSIIYNCNKKNYWEGNKQMREKG